MGSLFKPPKPPAPPEPAVMPEPDSTAVDQAKRRSLAAARNRSGVASTIRPGAGGTLGASTVLADSYGGKTLGGS